MAHIAGLVAVGMHPSPVPYADVVTSTTHKTLRGTRGAFILCKKELASNIDAAVFPGIQGGPLMHSIAAKAVGFYEALQPEFKEYQKVVIENARSLADELINNGIRLVSGGTDNHLMLIDLTNLGINGKQAQDALVDSGIVINRNAIPFDSNPRMITGGLRPGTPAATSRGLGKLEMKFIANLMIKVLRNINNTEVKKKVREEVRNLTSKYPIPGIDI
jgi:glycine hydroxymethyltransferase